MVAVLRLVPKERRSKDLVECLERSGAGHQKIERHQGRIPREVAPARSAGACDPDRYVECFEKDKRCDAEMQDGRRYIAGRRMAQPQGDQPKAPQNRPHERLTNCADEKRLKP